MFPGFAIFLFIGMILWWGFSPWMLFFLFFFILPKMRGWNHDHYNDHDDYEKQKRKNNEIKRKNDDDYIRSSDGEWLEVVD